VVVQVARVLVAAAAAVALSACGASREVDSDGAKGGWKAVEGYGLRIDLPPGWYGDVSKHDELSAPILRAATFELVDQPTDIGQEAQRTMEADDVLITIADYGPLPNPKNTRELQPATLPIKIERSHLGSFEGFREPVATRAFLLEDHALQVWVAFGSAVPTEPTLEEANDVLTTFAFRPSGQPAA
jgi:hypothetical protein